MQIAIALYPGFTATDAIGPYEVLSRLPGARTVFVAREPGLVASDTGFLRVQAEPLSAAPAPAIVVVPGGPTARVPTGDEILLEWIRGADRTVAQAIQLGIEYDPQPPFDAGSPLRAPAAARALLETRAGG